MNRERWRQARQLFETLLELNEELRPSVLERETAGDPELLEEVRSLLAAYEGSQGFLDEPFARLVDSTGTAIEAPAEPTSVGSYRLGPLLGRGGMGSVYLAARDDEEYHEQVAVKILRRDLANDELVRRFRGERQILADLTHPNVARLLDGGTTPDGRPYLVMEYVEGEPIDRWAARQKLDLAARLRLAAKVCSAVHAAHQRLIVHRDLKPANILVTAEGEPKLLDFGIAKLLQPADWAQTIAATAPGLAPLTLEYASPEQLRNQPITTASDVYALGVLLYELVTGHRPFRLGDGALDQFIRKVCEEHRPLASAGAIDPEVGDARKIRKQLAGDLDVVLRKALHREPGRRYGSAAALAADLENFLAGRPVTARPDTLLYRTRKFVRRHRWAVAATAAVAAGFVAFTVALFFQQQRTLEEKARAEEVTQFMTGLFRYADPERARGEQITVREVLDLGAREVEEGLDDDSRLKAELRGTFGRVYHQLGLFDRAEPFARGALELNTRQLGEDAPKTALSLQLVGDVHHERGDYAQAEASYQESLDRLGTDGDSAARETGLAGLARALWYQGRLDEAQQLQESALELAQTLYGSAHERIAANQHEMAELLRERSEYDAAQQRYEAALAAYTRLYGERHPEIARLHSNLGLLEQERGDYEQAEAQFRAAMDMRAYLYGAQHPAVAETQHSLADLLRARDRTDEAEELCRQSLAIRTASYGESHPLTALSFNLLGLIAKERGHLEEAARQLQRALTIWREKLEPEHPYVASAHNNLASVYQATGENAAARLHYGKALELYREIYGAEHMQVAVVLNNLATLLKADGEFESAADHYHEALVILRERLGPEHLNVAGATLNLATLRLSQERFAQAEELYRQALPILRDRLGEEHSTIGVCLTNLGKSLLAQGRLDEAAEHVSEAVRIYAEVLPRGHLWRLKALGAQGEIWVAQGSYRQAESVLLAAHSDAVEVQGRYTESARLACGRLADLYRAWGRPSQVGRWAACS